MSVFCRICRVQIFSQPIPLSNSSLRHSKLLYDMIFECTQIMLSKDSRLPQFLCQACAIRLDEAFAFLQQCRESEQIFAKTLPVTESPEKLDLRLKTPRPLTGTDAVKLELLPSEDQLTVPVPFSSVAASFAATYGHVLLEASTTDSNKNATALLSNAVSATSDSKDWMSEARKHRERQRISTARRRANMTPEQREKERERARVRQAQRRAGRSDDEIRAQRERDRIRQAIKRAKFREVEMIQQQQEQGQGQHDQSFALEPGINQFG